MELSDGATAAERALDRGRQGAPADGCDAPVAFLGWGRGFSGAQLAGHRPHGAEGGTRGFGIELESDEEAEKQDSELLREIRSWWADFGDPPSPSFAAARPSAEGSRRGREVA